MPDLTAAEKAAGVRLEMGREYCAAEREWGDWSPSSGKRQFRGVARVLAAKADDALAEAYAEIVWLAGERDRFRQDRFDALSVYSTDGLLSSEWVARTGAAERRAKQAEADLATAREEARKWEFVAQEAAGTPDHKCESPDLLITELLARYQPPTKSQLKRIAAQKGEEGGTDATD